MLASWMLKKLNVSKMLMLLSRCVYKELMPRFTVAIVSSSLIFQLKVRIFSFRVVICLNEVHKYKEFYWKTFFNQTPIHPKHKHNYIIQLEYVL